jgi:hypothetical protein
VNGLWLARLATGIAILLAFWNALRPGGENVVYSPTVALTCLTGIAIIWYTYFTWQTLEHARSAVQLENNRIAADRKQRRESLATALLYELKWVGQLCEHVIKSWRPGGPSMPDPTAVLALMPQHVELFMSETVAAVLECQGKLKYLRAEIDRAEHPESDGEKEAAAAAAKKLAEGLLAATQIARNRLVADGGTPPT